MDIERALFSKKTEEEHRDSKEDSRILDSHDASFAHEWNPHPEPRPSTSQPKLIRVDAPDDPPSPTPFHRHDSNIGNTMPSIKSNSNSPNSTGVLGEKVSEDKNFLEMMLGKQGGRSQEKQSNQLKKNLKNISGT